VVDADAVHLGEQSVSPADARALLGAQRLITHACHAPGRVTQPSAADAWLLSPVFAPRKGNPALGFDALERARQLLLSTEPRQALYALGGVDAAAAERCAQIGVGAAVVGAAFEAADPSQLLDVLGITR
jgi:thiamine-phosphate pyrophosphorylase